MGLSTSYSKAETDIKLTRIKQAFGSGIDPEPLKIGDPIPTEYGGYILADVGDYGFGITEANKFNVGFLSAGGWEIVDIDMPNNNIPLNQSGGALGFETFLSNAYGYVVTIYDNTAFTVTETGWKRTPKIAVNKRDIVNVKVYGTGGVLFIYSSNNTLLQTINHTQDNVLSDITYNVAQDGFIEVRDRTANNQTNYTFSIRKFTVGSGTEKFYATPKDITPPTEYFYAKGFLDGAALDGNMNIINFAAKLSRLICMREGDTIELKGVVLGATLTVKFYNNARQEIVTNSVAAGDSVVTAPANTVAAVITLGNTTSYTSIKIISRAKQDFFNLLDFGISASKTNAENTTAITNAFFYARLACGGTVFLPAGLGKIPARVVIPGSTDWCTVKFIGEAPISYIFGTISTFNKTSNGTILYNDTNQDCLISSNIGIGAYPFNLITLDMENIRFMTPDNPPCNGVNASKFNQLLAKNVSVETELYNVQNTLPTNNKAAFITPAIDNGALTRLENVSVQGFTDGLIANEHTHGTNILAHSCVNALVFNHANHASHFDRLCFQRNTNQVVVRGSHVFKIEELNMEYAGTGQTDTNNSWQTTQFELFDPSNFGIGEIKYANVRGAFGKVSTFRMNGGTGVIVKKIGSDTRLTGSGIPNT